LTYKISRGISYTYPRVPPVHAPPGQNLNPPTKQRGPRAATIGSANDQTRANQTNNVVVDQFCIRIVPGVTDVGMHGATRGHWQYPYDQWAARPDQARPTGAWSLHAADVQGVDLARTKRRVTGATSTPARPGSGLTRLPDGRKLRE
jgi:hypothetical protein